MWVSRILVRTLFCPPSSGIPQCSQVSVWLGSLSQRAQPFPLRCPVCCKAGVFISNILVLLLSSSCAWLSLIPEHIYNSCLKNFSVNPTTLCLCDAVFSAAQRSRLLLPGAFPSVSDMVTTAWMSVGMCCPSHTSTASCGGSCPWRAAWSFLSLCGILTGLGWPSHEGQFGTYYMASPHSSPLVALVVPVDAALAAGSLPSPQVPPLAWPGLLCVCRRLVSQCRGVPHVAFGSSLLCSTLPYKAHQVLSFPTLILVSPAWPGCCALLGSTLPVQGSRRRHREKPAVVGLISCRHVSKGPWSCTAPKDILEIYL